MSYDYDYYAGRDLICPVRPKKPTLSANHSSVDALAYADALVSYEKDVESFKTKMKEYSEKVNERYIQLKNEVMIDFGLTKHQFEYIWACALDKDTGGMSAVVEEFERLYLFVTKAKDLF